jgi:trehalose 6-phosphate synthase
VVESTAGPRDFVWVHDYHLMMLADALRARGLRSKMAYFHHIPFPAPDIFEKLPWRCEVLRGLLQFSSLGFQTERDSANFIACLERCFPETEVERPGSNVVVRAQGRCATAGAFPISIDYEAFAADAAAVEVQGLAASMREQVTGRRIVLGVDRLDYTKGVLQRLEAFRTLLARHEALRGQVALLQVVVPSREGIERYRNLKESIERLVSQIKGEYGAPGWTPVVYWHRSLPRTELLALYRAAEVALVTPLKDGMNLVAKEFCAARVDATGVLVLSEFAGASAELRNGALLVNPYDAEGMCEALARALRMPPWEQHSRMQWMRAVISQANVFAWCRSVWRAAGFTTPARYRQATPMAEMQAAMTAT